MVPSTPYIDLAHLGMSKLTNGGEVSTPRNKSSRSKVNLLTQLFKVGHQRVNIEVDLLRKLIEGFTEITIIPTSSTLKVIKLDCREMRIKNVFVNGSRITNYIYGDRLYVNDPKLFETLGPDPNIMDLYSENISINQHHLIRQKLNYILGEYNYDIRRESPPSTNGNTEELAILLPETLKFELTDINSLQTPRSQANTYTPLHLRSKATTSDFYSSIQVKIEYECVNPQNGVNFSTDDTGDRKFWHAYTTNADYNISTSSWVPCVDNMWDRSTWTLEVSVPRTVKDIGMPRIIGSRQALAHLKKKKRRRNVLDEDGNQVSNIESDLADDEDAEEDSADLVVCTGDYNNVKETPHPIDLSKKVVSWSIFNPVCAQHVGWAVGCFQMIELMSNNGENEEENFGESLDLEDLDKESSNLLIMLYCLPDQMDNAQNTCSFASKVLDFFLKEFGSFPFASYSIVFIQNNLAPTCSFAGLSILNSDLLYPPTLLDPILENTILIVDSIATQWSGINITPQEYNDLWCIVGIARFMSLQFIRTVLGLNEYKFRIKSTMNEVAEVDIGQKPLATQYFRFPISDKDLSFLKLKAPIVLYILDRRMTKTDKSFGLSRVLPKLFLQAMSSELPNSTLSTSHFQHVCEKVNRNKLDHFFRQWVYGAGVPIFHILQRFNKKRSLVEMSIRQIQSMDTKKLHPKALSFINDSISYLDNEPVFSVQPVFTGPMTIRIHEADGTPYEHIVDIKDGYTKLDIQYNSRYKRIKKNKEEGNDPISAFNKFGDVLTSDTDKAEWEFADWERQEDDSMNNDALEWVRVDSDFEWIAKINVKQQDYMYGSQLQHDRDVEAQYDAVQYFGNVGKANAVHCTVLTRTIFDPRYYYGVRIAAAKALAKLSNPSNNFIGLLYLIRVYKHLFCYKNSLIPVSNDFSDLSHYLLQKAMPKILCLIHDDEGHVPSAVCRLLLNLVKFNDNTNNPYQDCLYLAESIEALSQSATGNSPINLTLQIGGQIKNSESQKFAKEVLEEISRVQKLDEWVPSYHSVLGVTCLREKIRLTLHGLADMSFEDLLFYTIGKHPHAIRIEAFRGLFRLGGLKNSTILEYYLKTVLLENSNAYFRSCLITVFIDSIAFAAIDGTPSTLDDPEFKTYAKLMDNSKNVGNKTNMVIIEEDTSNSAMSNQRDYYARETLNGAIEILRRDYAIGEGLKSVFWELLHTSLIGIHERRDIFNACQVLYKEIDSLFVSYLIPCGSFEDLKKKLVAKSLGDGKISIRREGRFKIQLLSRKLVAPVTKKPTIEKAKKTVSKAEPDVQIIEPPKLTLKLNNSTSLADAKKSGKRPYDAKKTVTTPHILFSKNPRNKNQVTFHFKDHKLSTLPPLPTVSFSTSQSPKKGKQQANKKLIVPKSEKKEILNTRVLYDGANVTIKFDKSEKLRDILNNLYPTAASRFVRIFLKEKRVEISTEPFGDSTDAGTTVSEEHDVVMEKDSSETQETNEGVKTEPTLDLNRSGVETSKASLKLSLKLSSKDNNGLASQVIKEEPKEDLINLDNGASPIEAPVSISSRASLAEPESRSVERPQSPFSRSGSPFTSSSAPLKKKKTKIYIHSTGNSSKSASPDNEGEKSPEIVDSEKSVQQVNGKPKTKSNGFKLKLKLKS